MDFLFLFAGIAAAVHVYSYGIWLNRQGNTAGCILSLTLAAAAIIIPGYRLLM